MNCRCRPSGQASWYCEGYQTVGKRHCPMSRKWHNIQLRNVHVQRLGTYTRARNRRGQIFRSFEGILSFPHLHEDTTAASGSRSERSPGHLHLLESVTCKARVISVSYSMSHIFENIHTLRNTLTIAPTTQTNLRHGQTSHVLVFGFFFAIGSPLQLQPPNLLLALHWDGLIVSFSAYDFVGRS